MVAEVKPPRPPRVGVQRAVYVTDNAADARAAAEEARWNMRVTLSLRNNYERVEHGHAIAVPGAKRARHRRSARPLPGHRHARHRHPPDQAHRRTLVGITHFNCSFWFGDLEQARVLRSMELFAREVMPAFA